MQNTHIYTTKTGRVLASSRPLTYAETEMGICTRSIEKKDLAHIIDAPNERMARIVWQAAQQLRSFEANHCEESVCSIWETAVAAAQARQECLNNGNLAPFSAPETPFRFYETNKNRYAVSSAKLDYACLPDNPNVIREEMVSASDLGVTCFVPTFELADFLAAGVAHCNQVQHDADGAVVYRDGKQYLHLANLSSEEDPTVLHILGRSFRYQLALCQFYAIAVRC